jgi:transcriptional regulator with XRE-family HTH domain
LSNYATVERNRGWSKEAAAAKLGVSASVLWCWESVQRNPQKQYLVKFYTFLGNDPRPTPMTVGERLKRWREQRALTLTAMARRLGVARATLCRWDSGEREPQGAFLEGLEQDLHAP